MPNKISLNNIIMNVVHTDGIGVVNTDTYFHFKQEENIITANYSGGGITKGFLVGKLDNEKFEFRYAQLQTDGKLDGGYSDCEVKILEDGRVQIIEHFQWESREGTGTNIFEEIKESP